MEVKYILSLFFEKIGEEDLTKVEQLSDAQSLKLSKALGILNFIYLQIRCDYLPLISQEQVASVDGKIEYSKLSERFKKLIRLEKDGKRIKAKTLPTHIETLEDGEMTIEYIYIPKALNLDDEIFDNRLSELEVLYGMLSQHYLDENVFDQASYYDTLFKEAMSRAKYKGREIKVKERAWV
ncbi:MAG: hypothetical protein GX891_03080 [Clostridiales bacterium]|nr:hypothetical protein [Clostridiales bacterium]